MKRKTVIQGKLATMLDILAAALSARACKVVGSSQLGAFAMEG